MVSKYDIGDTVILTGTVRKIEKMPGGIVWYTLAEYDAPVGEEMIVGRVEKPWKLVNEAFERFKEGRP